MELVESMVAGLAETRQAAMRLHVQAMEDLIAPAPTGGGGLERLLHRLELAGHGDAVRSWGGAGTCCRLSPQQLHAALGDAEIERLAGRAGLTGDQLTAALSRHLPAIVFQQTRRAAAQRR